MSACRVVTPGRGVMGCKSSDTMVDVGGSVRERTWDHEPGAAHKSTTLVTSAKRLNCEFSCRSLNAERARHPIKSVSQYLGIKSVRA